MRDKYAGRPHQVRSPASARVHVWPSYAAAAEACERVNAGVWAKPDFNPFHHGGENLFFQTTLPPGPFCDYLLDRGIDPPAAGPDADNAGWVGWWHARRPCLGESQLAAVREAMNLIRFAEVAEVPAATAYVIQMRNWSCVFDYEEEGGTDPGEDAESAVVADDEGGIFAAVYRGRAQAEARCAEWNAIRRAEPDYHGFKAFQERDRAGVPVPLTTPMTETRFFEVVEVEAATPRDTVSGGAFYVLHRHAYRAGQPMSNQSQGPTKSRVALAAFSNRATALARSNELLRTARRTTNPFACLEHCNSRGPCELSLPWRVPPVPWAWPTASGDLGWYDNEAPHLTDDQRAQVWALFDERPLYGVYEVPAGDE